MRLNNDLTPVYVSEKPEV